MRGGQGRGRPGEEPRVGKPQAEVERPGARRKTGPVWGASSTARLLCRPPQWKLHHSSCGSQWEHTPGTPTCNNAGESLWISMASTGQDEPIQPWEALCCSLSFFIFVFISFVVISSVSLPFCEVTLCLSIGEGGTPAGARVSCPTPCPQVWLGTCYCCCVSVTTSPPGTK